MILSATTGECHAQMAPGIQKLYVDIIESKTLIGQLVNWSISQIHLLVHPEFPSQTMNIMLTAWAYWICPSFTVKTNREPWYSEDPTLSQFILYSWVSCLPIILIFVGSFEYNRSILIGSLVPNNDLRLFIKYLTATFLWVWPSTGIVSIPVSILNWRFPNWRVFPRFLVMVCGQLMRANQLIVGLYELTLLSNPGNPMQCRLCPLSRQATIDNSTSNGFKLPSVPFDSFGTWKW